jgi:purine-binding chemotaxis protein CheW
VRGLARIAGGHLSVPGFAEPEQSERFLLIRGHGQLCALVLAQVEEVMRPQPTRAVAGAPPFVRGVALIRGAAVPVVAAYALFGDGTPNDGASDDGAPHEDGPDTSAPHDGKNGASGRYVTLRTGDRRVALAVDEVLGVRTIAVARFSALPPLLGRANADIVSALGMLDAELLVVLRTGRLVPKAIWPAIDAAASLDAPMGDPA